MKELLACPPLMNFSTVTAVNLVQYSIVLSRTVGARITFYKGPYGVLLQHTMVIHMQLSSHKFSLNLEALFYFVQLYTHSTTG